MYEKQGRGVIAELAVHSDLIKQGYEVYSDAGQGLVDLVAIHPTSGKIRFLEVKCVARRADGSRINRMLKPHQKEWEAASGNLIEMAYADVETEGYPITYPERRRKIGA